MKVIDIIKNSEKPIFSFELLPPLKGNDASKIYNTVESLVDFDPKYINITTHRDEMIYKELPNGAIEKRVVRKRPGTVAIAAAIQHKYNIPVIPHILCGGFSKSETEHVLIDLNFMGIDNVLALRGDGQKTDHVFKPNPDGHSNANELVEQIVNLRSGKYLEEDLRNSAPLDFCIGVAGYPEKHFEAPNFETDLENLKRKVDAGADYIVTQMFFDNQKYYDFVARCRAIGITVPIIPGIKPINLKNQLTVLPKIFNIDIPVELANELAKCKDDAAAKQVGTEWAIQQSKDLIANKISSLHIYTYGVSDNTRKIVEAVF
ncbi:MAG: methylenetetrahydrofolate reductase [NAD(P)H] [Bacteroidetes bacterium GWF2_42_66]|nr:MAG: methylenetetrahydrofolate reductase [NAD(P)H] [Bacteroidetes bacterium GWE2_42_39]OFY42783.1 MAG: methylenetetrahydrofolate reductase [NAD(P)H] [Bacteroidetes bacterium GWF2_42_66]HBL74400.1 methylenetetrahydrofolate reductase [NAD(P)H] [Prolixibacteraceae bacterium]HCR91383.1 methylenetetrahydrofolate reductase [NAD(P)H] [Prolixibacteraceae bacterium]HCU61882.1 methylenetetrahydrofolate reductase [NAD(P)H] [Prolixibacteraceae bacterium]